MKTVLYVDDEPALCKAFERALRGPGIKVVTTTSPPEAVAMLQGDTFDVVATDYRMPGMDGLGVLRLARERAPGARRLLVSGQAEAEVEPALMVDAGVDEIVTKPWSLDDLRRVVRRAADHAVLERENRRLIDVAARRTQDAVDVLVRALRLRDRETLCHCERVARYSRAVGVAMGLGEEELDTLERGSLLHDLGKLGVRDSTLFKAGPLDAEEWAEMKKHPEWGAELLAGCDVFVGIRQIVLEHHERWDGKGYPAGLSGEQIGLSARILAVTDTYDAIRSDRPYRKGASHATAIAEIQRCAGSQFDARVVETFCSLADAIEAVSVTAAHAV